MLVFLWMCVATSAFMPNGDSVVKCYTNAVESYYSAMLNSRG